MPFIIKNTLIFRLKEHGWTESWWRETPTDDLRTWASQLNEVAQKRAKLLGSPAAVKALRVSVEINEANEKVTGDSFLAYVDYQGSPGEPADEPDAALQVIFRDTKSAKRKLLFLRGIWDSIDKTGGQYDPTAGAWQSLFNDWSTIMTTQGCGWYGVKKAASANITTYTRIAESQQVVFTLDGPVFGPGPYKNESVRIRGLNGKSALNGQLLVIGQSATSARTVKPIAVGPFISPGVLTSYSRLFTRAATIDGQKIVTRRVGSPLLVSRGRAAARVKV